MEAKATLRNVRISPRKARLVVDAIRGLSVPIALARLSNLPNKGARDVIKVLRSAIANADQQDSSVDVDSFVVRTVFVDEGPTLKRFRPRAMGRAYPIRKRTSHITVVVGE
ncbi:MAG: 50S ribosomal protein L22 [bacterium]|jgi:large subunit ribosomal protein L22